MNSSSELKNLFEALAKAQAEMPVAGLNANNPFFKSKYASLPDLVKASRPVLTKNGLAVIQGTKEEAMGRITIHTRLCHTSGEWIESIMSLNPNKPGIQELGKEMSYLKRYQYAMITGVIASDDPDDDDGESAMTHHRGHNNQRPTHAERISKEQYDDISHAIESLPASEQELIVEKLYEFYKIKSLADLPKDTYRQVIDRLRKIIENGTK